MLEIPQEINKVLREIGLDRTESQVYFLLLQKGILNIQDITNQLKLPRSSVQLACENLLSRNVIKFSTTGKRRNFYVERPKDIDNFIKYEENILNLNKMMVSSVITKLNHIYINSQKIEPIEIEELKGEEGFIKTFYDSLNQPPNSETLRIGSDPSSFIVGREQLKKFSQERMKRKIYTRLLIPNSELSKIEIKEAVYKMREVRILNKELFDPKIQMSVWQENTAITVWDKGLHSIIIKNKSIADTFRQLFEIVWKQAKSK